MCVLCVSECDWNTLDITWHLMESINISSACGCMCTDLVGSSSTSLSCGFSSTGGSGRFVYDVPDVFKINCYGLGVVRCM